MTELSPQFLAQSLESAIEAAQEGGEVLRHYWGRLKQVRQKSGSSDLVTEADQEAEEKILALLTAAYPDHSWIGEESGAHEKEESDFLWAVDPLDGTTNYIHQYPMVCVSIGLLYKGKPMVGVVYNPITEELFEGARGKGVRLNGEAIRVSQVERVEESLLVTGFAYDKRKVKDNNFAEFCHLVQKAQGLRRAGSAALDLANLAMGRVDGYWERALNIWDLAAGALLVEEAGGIISAYDGGEVDLRLGQILASNGRVHKELCQELQLVKEKRVRGIF